jgi:hypothetical protein
VTFGPLAIGSAAIEILRYAAQGWWGVSGRIHQTAFINSAMSSTIFQAASSMASLAASFAAGSAGSAALDRPVTMGS